VGGDASHASGSRPGSAEWMTNMENGPINHAHSSFKGIQTLQAIF
jgi:hypothetical protein